MEEKRRRGVITVLLLGASVLVFLLLPKFAAGAADANKWHADPGRHASSPCPLPAPPPTAGADLPAQPPTHGQQQQQQTAPHFGFPLQPPTLGASSAPPPGGEGYPFIGSNPTVPLPTGMTDTATVLPLPDTGDAAAGNKVVGLAASVRAHHQGSSSSMAMIGPLLFCLAILFLHGHY